MSTPDEWRRIAAENAKKPRFGLQSTLERLQKNDSEMILVEMAGWTHVVPRLLCESLLQNRSLVTLSLQACRLGDDGVKKICPALEQGNLPLRHLNLSANGIGDEGAAAVGNAIRQHRTLRDLILSWNGIGDVGASALADALMLMPNNILEVLDLAGVLAGRGGGHSDAVLNTDKMDSIGKIGDAGCLALAKSLPGSNLHTLILSRQSRITAIGIASLADSLQRGAQLKHLELQRIPVDDEGAKSLGSALGECSLHSLDLAINKITDRGAFALGLGIAASQSLYVVKLTQSSIGLQGLGALVRAATTNITLKQFELYGHEAGKAGSQEVWKIKPWLHRNRSMHMLLGSSKRDVYPAMLAQCASLSDKTRLFRILCKMVHALEQQVGTKREKALP